MASTMEGKSILSGTRIFGIWKRKQKNISKTAGFTKAGTGLEINPAYNLFEEDSFSFTSFIVMVLFL